MATDGDRDHSSGQSKGGRAAPDFAELVAKADSLRVSRRSFVGRSAGVALAVGGIGSFLAACGSSGGQVNVLSWISYVDRNVKRIFEDTYPGITMNGTPAPADQDMFTKIKAGGGGQYDIVFANAGWTPTYYKNGLTEVLDLKDFPQSTELYSVFREDTSLPYLQAPDKSLLYPNMWASLSMTWNTTVPFQPPQPYSWSAMWSPELPSNHVMLQGGSEDIIAMTGLEQGVPRDRIYAMKGADLDRVVSRLQQLKPFQLNPNSLPQFRQAISSEKAWIGFTSDLSEGPVINKDAGKNIAKSVVPKEGSVGWIDGPQLVKGAKNRENAMKFIDFFGGNEKLLDYLWTKYRFAQANQAQVERILKKGGADAAFVRKIEGNRPDLVRDILFSRPPDDTQAWSAAWDQVTAS